MTFEEALATYGAGVSEVYFPWPGLRTCRNELPPDGASRLLAGLKAAKSAGKALCLLINANCYAGRAISKEFEGQIVDAIDNLHSEGCTVDSVTTTSPFAAHVIKKHYGNVQIRASINMRLGFYTQMEKLFELFDGFYMAREYNYELEHISHLKEKLEKSGKKLFMLANSGCMAHCPGQIFHDNLVAHETQISKSDNARDFNPYVCWMYYSHAENLPGLLKNTWIRPEDIRRYEGLFECVKLATRISPYPTRVIKAYLKGSFKGNALELTEPSYAGSVTGILDNTLFPDDWFDKRSSCHRNCDGCDYCNKVWDLAWYTFF